MKKTLIMLVLALFSAITFAGGPTCPIPSTNSAAHLTEGHRTAYKTADGKINVSGRVELTYQVDHDVTIFVEAHNEYGYVAGASVTIQRGSQKETYHISSDRLENGKPTP